MPQSPTGKPTSLDETRDRALVQATVLKLRGEDKSNAQEYEACLLRAEICRAIQCHSLSTKKPA